MGLDASVGVDPAPDPLCRLLLPMGCESMTGGCSVNWKATESPRPPPPTVVNLMGPSPGPAGCRFPAHPAGLDAG